MAPYKKQINQGKLGKQRFCKFCSAIKKLIGNDRLHFDLIIAAGNSGQSLAKFTELIYKKLEQIPPPKLQIPFFRYLPGFRDKPDKVFNSKVFLPRIFDQLKNLNKEVVNVLFVDDEIGLGLTATNILNLLNQALKELGKPKIENYYIVAEDQGFKVPKKYPEIKFIPYDFESEGYNNTIFLFNPWELEKPIIDVLGNDDKFAFHLRTNLLLGLPIKDFNGGKPIYTDKFLKIAKEKIPDFQKLQENYLIFIEQTIKDCLS
ncbi:hypothetical protein A2160_05860 [Candidatus Beckwithbacteria bacterium RBG_13_42_9]|uniref:Phosphoribosyltransferase domain-containing protein n=1 Tax=Candidatus Beckwithbacteria bacterium RBG_13_42_9 TaxID=1797457 RepID=A0A1F5E597_9BACT|nr:MAG: hypothetical protein A2160_05860 [Candidatus Beckwithbacteria bacterium RBG_13_42_9]